MSDAVSSHSQSSCPGKSAKRVFAQMTRASTPVVAGQKDVDGRDKPGHDGGGGGRRRVVGIAVALAFALIVITTTFAAWVVSLGPLPLEEARKVSTTVVDRNGKLLRAYAMADGRWRLPVDAKSAVDVGYLKLLLAYEDRRFWSHGGVDPLALGRAALQFGSRGHIVSGGSTITMQLARLMEPRRERSLYAKLRQMVRAVQIERQLSKDEILDLYLALAPFGGNLEGIRAASIAYFGKESKRLSLAEAALLVALPQSPERRRLDRYPEAAHAARDRVLARMVEDGVVSKEVPTGRQSYTADLVPVAVRELLRRQIVAQRERLEDDAVIPVRAGPQVEQQHRRAGHLVDEAAAHAHRHVELGRVRAERGHDLHRTPWLRPAQAASPAGNTTAPAGCPAGAVFARGRLRPTAP